MGPLNPFFVYKDDKADESIIDSIPHCHTGQALKMRIDKEIWLRFYIEDKVGMEYLSSIVFHTVILKSFENERKKEIWLRFYIEDKVGMECLSSIVFHTGALKNFEN